MKKEQTIYWNNPKERIPSGLQMVLVVYENKMFPGVYSNGIVSLFPDDYGEVRIQEVNWWAALPNPPTQDDMEREKV